MRNHLALAAALCLSLGLSFAAAPAEAHHSMAMFDMTKTVTVVGTVKEFQWTNPHCYIQLNAKDGKEWSLEMGAPMYLYSNGWRPKSVKPGDQITVHVYPLRDGKPGGVVIDVKTPDGKVLGKKKV